MIFLKDTLFLIYLIQGLIIVSIIILSIYYGKVRRIQIKRKEELRIILLQTFKENLPLTHLPPYFRQLSLIIPVLEALDQKIGGPLWEQLKERLIYDWLAGEFHQKMRAKKWDKIAWALRALRLCPKTAFEESVLSHLSHPSHSVRLLAIDSALQIQTPPLIKSLLSQLNSANEYYKFPYLDAFLRSDESVWRQMVRLYREDPTLQSAALQILGRRAPFLSLDDIKKALPTLPPSSRWWAIEALKNIPSEESCTLLIEETNGDDPQRRLHAAYILGTLRAFFPSHFETLLKDENRDTRLAAGWALSHHKRRASPEIEQYLSLYSSKEIDDYLLNATLASGEFSQQGHQNRTV